MTIRNVELALIVVTDFVGSDFERFVHLRAIGCGRGRSRERKQDQTRYQYSGQPSHAPPEKRIPGTLHERSMRGQTMGETSF